MPDLYNGSTTRSRKRSRSRNRSGRDVEPMERAKVHKYDLAASSMEQLPDFGLQHERNSKIEPR